MTGLSGGVALPNSTLTFTLSGPDGPSTGAWLVAWNNLWDPWPLIHDSNGGLANDYVENDEFTIPPVIDDTGCYNKSQSYLPGRWVTSCTIKLGTGPYYGTPSRTDDPLHHLHGRYVGLRQPGDNEPFVANCAGTCSTTWSPTSTFVEFPVFIQPSPYAGFTETQSGTSEQFTDTTLSDLPITGYSWNFGDNQTGSGADPLHEYTKGGAYTVTETVTTNDGQTSTVSQSVDVVGALSVTVPTIPTIPVGQTVTVPVTVTNNLDADEITGITWVRSICRRRRGVRRLGTQRQRLRPRPG